MAAISTVLLPFQTTTSGKSTLYRCATINGMLNLASSTRWDMLDVKYLMEDAIIPIQRRSYCHKYTRSYPIRKRSIAVTVQCSQVQLEDINDEACELVSGVDLVIGEGEDSIHAYLLNAVKNNNGIGLLLLSDIFGFEDSATRDFAYRVACNGYNVLVPDLFRGDPWTKLRPEGEVNEWITNQSPSRVSTDIETSTKWLVDEFTAAGLSSKLGIIGFCFGGGKVIETLARDCDFHFGAGVCFYPTRIDASVAKDVNVPVLFVCGDGDHLCSASKLEETAKSVGVGGGDSRVVVYEGRGHGFVHRPETQEDDEDAEEAFALARNWLQDHLVLSNNK